MSKRAPKKRQVSEAASSVQASVKESAQHIWLAGMGAFSKAQEEGGKVFEALVKEGLSLQRKTQGIAEQKISGVTGKMSAMTGKVSAKTGQNCADSKLKCNTFNNFNDLHTCPPHIQA
jgi:poly(hydroxyalkanoate) granule-associated protein